MAEETHPAPEMRAMVDFACLDEGCSDTVLFNVMELRQSKGRVACTACHREYCFDAGFLDKLERLRHLILAVMSAEDILGDINVAVTTPAGDVKIPYRLLLTRLNSVISLQVGGRTVDFNFRIEPLENGSFR